MYSSYIISADTVSTNNLTSYIERTPDLTLMGSSNNSIEALHKIKKGCSPEIIFLDVEMPEFSDLTVVDLLPKESAIILVAETTKHAVAGYDKEIVDFLFQPVEPERFAKGIHKAQKYLFGISNKSILISGDKGAYIQLASQEIMYIEALDHVMHIYTLTNIQLVKISLRELEKKLPSYHFTRIHKSFIINNMFMKLIKGNQIMMSNDKLLPIGKKYRSDVSKKLKALIL
jgi:two-component system LytT family response regulator